jgi:thiamine biosynthesis lipoprotein
MGSEISLSLDASGVRADLALRRTQAVFQAWERRLSRFQPGSELSALNRSQGQPVRVSRTLWHLLHAAVIIAEATEGLVTPTVLSALEAAGYGRSFERLAPGAPVPVPRVLDVHALTFDAELRTVTVPEGLRLDLGGLVKGWAADEAVRRLGRLGPAQVNAGGDLAVSGPRADGSPWQVAVESPHRPGAVLGVLSVEQGGVATSGRNHRAWRQGELHRHHLIDPRTGLPAVTDVFSATVVGPSALVAEVAAKRVLLLGSRAGLEWLEQHPTLAAFLVLEDGQVLESRRLAASESAAL